MSWLFSLEKYYIDVVTDDNLVLVLYYVRTRFGFLTRVDAGVERFEPDGSSRIYKAAQGGPLPEIKTGHAFEVRLEFPEGPLMARFNPVHGGWRPGSGQPVSGMHWSVIAGHGQVQVRWPVLGRGEVQGRGYCDRVVLARLPRSYKMSGLEWGRVHRGGQTLVFDKVTFVDQPPFQCAVVWDRQGDMAVFESYRLTSRNGLWEVALVGRSQTEPWRWHTQRTLHDGAVLHRARFPSAWERACLSLLLGRSHETRWLGTVDDGDHLGGGAVIHESVRFGNAKEST